jgi:GntR family transcriptional regulator
LNVLEGRISLDFRADEPIYLQIVRQIETLVTEGTLKPGDQLPTVRALAIDLRINFSTVARAYRILDEQQLISTQRGRGTYIWDESADEKLSQKPLNGIASEKLAGLAKNFFRDAIETGASLEQIERVLRRQLEDWKHT